VHNFIYFLLNVKLQQSLIVLNVKDISKNLERAVDTNFLLRQPPPALFTIAVFGSPGDIHIVFATIARHPSSVIPPSLIT
jgi:hypothetical protein